MPRVATTGLHKGSIFCCLGWLRVRERVQRRVADRGERRDGGGSSLFVEPLYHGVTITLIASRSFMAR